MSKIAVVVTSELWWGGSPLVARGGVWLRISVVAERCGGETHSVVAVRGPQSTGQCFTLGGARPKIVWRARTF
jgi:hypothetical protein